MSQLRSDLVRRVLGSLRDHPHDDTASQIASRLGFVERDAVQAALQVLREDGYVGRADEHWALTRSGWDAARSRDPRPDAE